MGVLIYGRTEFSNMSFSKDQVDAAAPPVPPPAPKPTAPAAAAPRPPPPPRAPATSIPVAAIRHAQAIEAATVKVSVISNHCIAANVLYINSFVVF